MSGRVEREVHAFLAAFDHAIATRDIAFLERAFPDDYVMTGISGRKSDRAQGLAFFRHEGDSTSYRMVSIRHEQVVVRTVGTMAVVTTACTSQTTSVDASNAEPDSYTARHPEVLEKRRGRRMLIAEQDTEQMHDDKLMERQVAMADREYHAVVQRLRSGRSEAGLATSGDLAAIVRVFLTNTPARPRTEASVARRERLSI